MVPARAELAEEKVNSPPLPLYRYNIKHLLAIKVGWKLGGISEPWSELVSSRSGVSLNWVQGIERGVEYITSYVRVCILIFDKIGVYTKYVQKSTFYICSYH